jgi:hypothetical protein
MEIASTIAGSVLIVIGVHDMFHSLMHPFVTLATLGFGDVVPADPWIRLASPLQALTGFALLTAALTWFTQIYPPLARRRTLALDLKTLADVDYPHTMSTLDPVAGARVLEVLAGQVNEASVDLTQHTESYYFQEQDASLSLARQLPYALQLRDAASSGAAAELQAGSRRLGGALEHIAATLRQFVDSGDTPEDVLRGYADDHHHSARS